MILTVRIETARPVDFKIGWNLSIACAVDQATIATTFIDKDGDKKDGDKTKYKHNHEHEGGDNHSTHDVGTRLDDG